MQLLKLLPLFVCLLASGSLPALAQDGFGWGADPEQRNAQAQRDYIQKLKNHLPRTASCDSRGRRDELDCCAFPRESYSVRIKDNLLPKGQCFTPGQTLPIIWDVVLRPGGGHAPYGCQAGDKRLESATLQPTIGYWNPYTNDRPLFAVDKGQQFECASRGFMNFRVPSYLQPEDMYPNNPNGWYISLATFAPASSGRITEVDRLEPALLDPLEGFVISDKAGCRIYRQKLNEKRQGSSSSTNSDNARCRAAKALSPYIQC